jgi:hypothetical protein
VGAGGQGISAVGQGGLGLSGSPNSGVGASINNWSSNPNAPITGTGYGP